MKRYFVSYLISVDNPVYTQKHYGNNISNVKCNFDIREIENYLKEIVFEDYSKTIKSLKKEDVEIIILFFKELKDYEG